METDNKMQVPVWDIAVRLFHWLFVCGFVVAWFAEGEWMQLHIIAGILLYVLIVFRLVWGFVGTEHARFADFMYRPRVVLRHLGDVLLRRAVRYRGHNPAGGAMIFALLGCVLLTCTTGLLLYGGDAWRGPLAWLMKHADYSGIEFLDRLHVFSANLTMFLVFFHIAGVLWESVLHRENLVKAMITGYKPKYPGQTKSSNSFTSNIKL
jgi:cytochrome b